MAKKKTKSGRCMHCLRVTDVAKADHIFPDGGQDFRLSGRGESQAGNDDEMFEFKAGGNDVLAEGNQVVLVGSTDFLNRSVKAQAFEGGTFEPWSWR